MLNAAANHGFLARNGHNISLADLQTGLAAAINLDPGFSIAPFTALLPYSTTGVNGTLHLHDLVAHNVIEHDGSLSRDDYYFGDSVSFSGVVWDETSAALQQKGNSSSSGGDMIIVTIEDARQARNTRLAAAAARNPAFDLGETGAFNSLGEISQTIVLFDTSRGKEDAETSARLDWMDVFFREERLPWDLGWQPSADTIYLDNVYDMMKKVNETVYCSVEEC